MMFAGLYGHSIAFNEHGIAPRATPLGTRPGAVEERQRNAKAAKRARRNGADVKGPSRPAPAGKRERTVLRELRLAVRKAMRRGDRAQFTKLATRFELMMAQRSQRLAALK